MKMRTFGLITQIAAVLVFLTSITYGFIGASYSFRDEVLIAFIQGHLNNPAIMWAGIIGMVSSCGVIAFNMQVYRMGKDMDNLEELRIAYYNERKKTAAYNRYLSDMTEQIYDRSMGLDQEKIVFAQEHVKKALERAANNMSDLWQARSGEIKTILESYPDSEIK